MIFISAMMIGRTLIQLSNSYIGHFSRTNCGFCVLMSIVLYFTDTGKVDLIMNVVERPSGGFSAGGGISSG